MKHIVIIGSSSMDFVVSADKRPEKGETIIGNQFVSMPGGKGANQAVAAARLGSKVTMLGSVGTDRYADEILNNFKKNNVSTEHLRIIPDVSTGTAHITIAEKDNSIIVVKGANEYVTVSYIEEKINVIEEADIVLIQQEIPADTVEYVIELCEQLQKKIILNPAPYRKVSKELLKKATYLTPNEHECQSLFEEENQSDILRQFPNQLMITEGENGVRYFDGTKECLIPSYSVDVVDTTGAGDTFNAAFAVSLVHGERIDHSIDFANYAAALSVKKIGAQGGMPTKDEMIKQFPNHRCFEV
ncbi:ribokinase [Alkalihalobacillus trypoxylicola]|uniref:Ribokinase n=1 Tax=Alkalihalobacillus trypoxylicola TaxID=519424 RepID=A0A161PX19_9BACI|nr:ribokinase [Alkalihalobacillus trypoxylicola]KYG26692.1 ribokinase [Alkalihalobacillus trypoxylicola]